MEGRADVTARRRVRLRDVAAAAGVSVATASRVLSGGNNTSRHAVDMVLAASKRLGYRPDPIARALRAQATGLVGMVLPGVGNPFFAELVEATELSLQSAGLELLLGDSRGSTGDEAHRLQTMIDRKVDGLLVIPTDHLASAVALSSARDSVPVVQIDRQVDGFCGDYVGVDNGFGIQLILEHLMRQGCKRVIFVSATAGSSTGRSRLDAFEMDVSRLRGLSATVPPLLGDFSVAFGRSAAQKLLHAAEPLPDGIVCGSDIIALGVVRELRRAGVSIPGEVLITGFDGILFAELCDPPITTVRQPITTIADEAVRLLAARLLGDQGPARRSEIAPALEVRGSSLQDKPGE